MTKTLDTSVTRQSDEYQSLIDECQAILTEHIWISRVEVIVAHGKIGERLVDDPLYKRYERGNMEFLKMVAEDIGISYSEISRCVQFYKKFKIVSADGENWSKFKEGKNLSWNKIKKFYLPQRVKESCKHSFKQITCWECRICHKVFKTRPDGLDKKD